MCITATMNKLWHRVYKCNDVLFTFFYSDWPLNHNGGGNRVAKNNTIAQPDRLLWIIPKANSSLYLYLLNRLNLITTTLSTTTCILSITTPQRSRTITMRIKHIQLITIDSIDWREKKNNIPRGEIITKKKSNNNIFSKCVSGDNNYSVWWMVDWMIGV